MCISLDVLDRSVVRFQLHWPSIGNRFPIRQFLNDSASPSCATANLKKRILKPRTGGRARHHADGRTTKARERETDLPSVRCCSSFGTRLHTTQTVTHATKAGRSVFCVCVRVGLLMNLCVVYARFKHVCTTDYTFVTTFSEVFNFFQKITQRKYEHKLLRKLVHMSSSLVATPRLAPPEFVPVHATRSHHTARQSFFFLYWIPQTSHDVHLEPCREQHAWLFGSGVPRPRLGAGSKASSTFPSMRKREFFAGGHATSWD